MEAVSKVAQPRMTVDVGRFLGLRRITVLYVVIFLLIASWASTLFQIYQIQHIATRNSTALSALCIFRQDLVNRRDQNVKFLSMTKEQRVKKYGDLGNIPDSVIKNSLNGQNQTISSLDALRCH